MPRDFERKVAARGGAIRWRKKSLDHDYLQIAITRDKGPRGGRTVAYKKKKKHNLGNEDKEHFERGFPRMDSGRASARDRWGGRG